MNRQPVDSHRKTYSIIAFVVISMAVVGYFVGLQSPMNPEMKRAASESGDSKHHQESSEAVPATDYADMHVVTKQRSKTWLTSLSDLKFDFDPTAEIVVTPEQKTFALQLREKNRAFNGAPPTIPHPVDQMSANSCMACHGNGIKTESLRISKMSHQFLANCTQCHVENNPTHMQANLFKESEFVGLPAPTGGPRAYEGAPPMIPHSTWMRVDCMSCHGFAGQQGIRTTHPWRQNCQQCHAPSSKLDQIQLESQPQFLPALEIER